MSDHVTNTAQLLGMLNTRIVFVQQSSTKNLPMIIIPINNNLIYVIKIRIQYMWYIRYTDINTRSSFPLWKQCDGVPGKQVHMYLESQPGVPWITLKYIIAEATSSGWVGEGVLLESWRLFRRC